MKRLLHAFFFLLAIACPSAGQAYYSLEDITFSLDGSFEEMAKARFSRGHTGERLKYRSRDINISYELPVKEETQIFWGFGDTSSKIGWDGNPEFTQQNFNTFNVTFGAKSKEVKDWDLDGSVTARFDTERGTLAHNTLYRIVTHGRYTYTDDIGLHVGFVAHTGLRKDKVFPILGVDYALTPEWSLSLILPEKLAVAYAFHEYFTAELATKTFFERHRVGHHETLSRGFAEYSNVGTELAINMKKCEKMEANIHAGATWGGRLRTSTARETAATHYHLRSVFYMGARVAVSF
ncbi:MAG: hypothetical protein K0S07_111 [Chlamydiales bacterium]|jgi:hypothetical protein|nr:hypothetical protein [Chlamydiales bacterium]